MSMNVLDAAYNTVNDYPGGAASLAPRMGKSASSLAHELRGQGSAKLGLLDAVKVMDMADSNVILEAIAAHRHCQVMPLPDGLDPDSCTTQGLREIMRKLTAFADELCEADADDEFNANEVKAGFRRWSELVAVGNALMRNVLRKHQADFPDSSLVVRDASVPGVTEGGAA